MYRNLKPQYKSLTYKMYKFNKLFVHCNPLKIFNPRILNPLNYFTRLYLRSLPLTNTLMVG